MEKRIIERILELSGVSKTVELEKVLLELIQSAKEGHLCHLVDDISVLPQALFGEGKPLVLDENRLYLERNWALETNIFHKVLELRAHLPQESPERYREALAKLNNLEEKQRSALLLGFENMFTLFTGGPGTGKTFTASCFIRLLAAARDKPLKVAIAAPTGKAAAHLESALRSQGPIEKSLKCESSTLHRLLRLQPGMQRLQSSWTIDADLVVVDEASMLDASLLVHLLNAMGPKTRLLLLGDPDQLPPVEGGALFADLAELFGQKLTRSIRIGSGGLLDVSNGIREGKIVQSEAVEWIEIKDHNLLIEKLPNPMSAIEPIQPKEDKTFRLLCALRQGPFGSDALNQAILAHYEKECRDGQWLTIPIMIAQNDPKQQLYNGTTGVLVRKANEKKAFAYFEGTRKMAESELPRYEIAFCLSVHKSQGSEYEEVALLFPPGSEAFGREALYTGVTRAKKRATVAIDGATLESLLKITSKKRSGLRARLSRTCAFREL